MNLFPDGPFQSYVYSYPHKLAYRSFAPLPLRDIWQKVREADLYVHIPFCSMRCGFCNLFTKAKPGEGLVAAYLAALARQVETVSQNLPELSFRQAALGGGTPTFLTVEELETLFQLLDRSFPIAGIPWSVEVSPESIDAAKVHFLRDRVQRVSIGVQSFLESESSAVGRPQRRADVEKALGLLEEARFPVFNIDLIYGLPGQTPESWQESLQSALSFSPNEFYLYPLYVRPLTALGQSRKNWDDQRLAFYRQGRDTLLAHGFEQCSLRHFRKTKESPTESFCQREGVVGLGCGARSYTPELHYSFPFAVRAKAIGEILAAYIRQEQFSTVDYGFALTPAEQRRRFLLSSLLATTGLSRRDWNERFGSEPETEFPQLHVLRREGLLADDDHTMSLTPLGLEWSDAIGPLFFSELVQNRLANSDRR